MNKLNNIYLILFSALINLFASSVAISDNSDEFKSLLNQWFVGRCHMNHCSRFMITSSEAMGYSKNGSLLLIHTKNRDEEYMGSFRNRPAKVELSSGSTYIFCSKTLPSIILKDGSSWVASFLKPGEPEAFSGAYESAYSVYYAACHNTSRTVSDNLAKVLGYKFKDGILPDDRKVASPFEVLNW
jgi:hypothetical protein